MKERPINFNNEMVRAILSGVKTQTRRVVEPEGAHHIFPFLDLNGNQTGEWAWCGSSHVVNKHIRCPYGQPGDRLWVREDFAQYPPSGKILYKADYSNGAEINSENYSWINAKKMTQFESRITLEITNVRVERVRNISEKDAKAEAPMIKGCAKAERYRIGFKVFWESIYGDESWCLNPWVWVIEFKVVL